MLAFGFGAQYTIKSLLLMMYVQVYIGLGWQGHHGRQFPIKGSHASVKEKFGGQAWLTHVPCPVRRGPEDHNSLDKLRGQAWLTHIPCLVRLRPKEFALTRSKVMS